MYLLQRDGSVLMVLRVTICAKVIALAVIGMLLSAGPSWQLEKKKRFAEVRSHLFWVWWGQLDFEWTWTSLVLLFLWISYQQWMGKMGKRQNNFYAMWKDCWHVLESQKVMKFIVILGKKNWAFLKVAIIFVDLESLSCWIIEWRRGLLF